jgi:D-alanine-D-alanine ligase
MEMPEAIEKAFSEGEEVVIESMVKGRELTCGLYKSENKITPLPVTEIISNNDFFDFNAKYNGESKEITPAEIPTTLSTQIQDVSKRIFKRLGLSGIARIDYIVDNKNQIYLIEVNTTPGMSDQSIVPQQISAAKLNLKDVLNEIMRT